MGCTNHDDQKLQFDSLVVQGVPARKNEYGSIMPPIFLSSTYRFEDIDNQGPYEYVRTQNPTRQKAENLIATLEGAKFAFGFSSGMAALTTVFEAFNPGDHIISSANIYGGTYRYFTDFFPKKKIDCDFYYDLNQLKASDFKPNTKAVFLESPANPTLRVVDIARIAKLAHDHGAILIVDNTFMTSYLQKPLQLGADVVAYSATKYYGGHADLCAGFIVTDRQDLAEQFQDYQNTLGATISPFDSYTLIRGTKTLSLRLDRQMENVKAVTEALQTQEGVAKVYFPGSFSEEEAAIQAKQARGNGAVLSFEVTPDVDLKAFFNNLQMIDLAVSLGGVESLVCRPATMTHEPYPRNDLEKIGVGDNMVRFSVGIENKNDIIHDVTQALTSSLKRRASKVV
ncbi:cystathionine beta-lyase [Agrilactobacillus composti DSM 18527 = JCM 14202]|uniref:homocysteine desulfhydrase n=1 Tax=Agrilactobacillus composti DSM 18527 = JCM 14202 TaxID=1423734 RepID=X0PCU6_9LACO|nr:PLP-dependent aspartate aminotransferase family protein [Agrilactobacillus composti]KRM33054.1 cystathionine beta-lyase [Agrilactobacillus composti DSM 18527 = JCM 14202]GAF38599.1 cystathionine gamma-lyase [Agrilactobacillus composti DSM 18527 = JCM 14202]